MRIVNNNNYFQFDKLKILSNTDLNKIWDAQ